MSKEHKKIYALLNNIASGGKEMTEDDDLESGGNDTGTTSNTLGDEEFATEWERSGHIQSKNMIAALTPSTLHERETFRKNCQFMERHAKAAPPWQEAADQLGAKYIRQAWMPGLLPCVNLRWWQVTGVAWAKKKLPELGGVIIADVMGLGKSLQRLCTILAQNNDRERSGQQDHPIWGPPLPNFVIGPKSVITEWKHTCDRSLSGNYSVVEYTAKARHLF
jgi:SNF2 family DNA or RNA helicase